MTLWPSLTGKSLKPFFALDVPRALASSAVLDGRKKQDGQKIEQQATTGFPVELTQLSPAVRTLLAGERKTA